MKTYIFSQYNNKDNFGKVQFANSGQTFNPLVYETNLQQNLAVLPIGKSFSILGVDDIKYYDVKHLQLHLYIIPHLEADMC